MQTSDKAKDPNKKKQLRYPIVTAIEKKRKKMLGYLTLEGKRSIWEELTDEESEKCRQQHDKNSHIGQDSVFTRGNPGIEVTVISDS